MKKSFRLAALLLAVCLAAPWITPAGVAAAEPAGAATHTASSSDEFHRALAAAQDGDVIQVSGSFVLKNPQSNNDSLVIDKAVTIQGGSMTLWYAGILLGADVTFKDITLGLGANVRPAIMANGHTLTLENVQRDPTARYIHLFCGGQTGATQGDLSAAKQGGHGQIILRGNTNLGLANIYAGSISTDGTNNEFTKSATVTIESSVKGQPIEHIYACGALQTYTSENDWFDYEHEVNPPFASPGNFKVRGTVTFNLYSTAAKRVSGDTGVLGNLAQVNYKGTDYLNDSLLLSSIGELKVESGSLVPAAGQLEQKNVSTEDRTAEIVPVSGGNFFGNNAALGVDENATLGLQKLDSAVSVGSFTGGGSLVLGQTQTLTVAGTVSGTTTVGIGGVFNGHSQDIPTVGSTYINAVNSTADSFTLAAYANRPDIQLVKDGNGAWSAKADENTVIVKDFKLASAVVEAETEELPSLAFCDVSASSERCLYSLDLTILINGAKADWNEETGVYTDSTHKISVYVADNDNQTGEVLCISNAENEVAPVPAGTYVISVTVPVANSGTGQPIIRTAILTVKAAEGGATVIPDPTIVDDLVYNGKEQVGVSLNAAYTVTGGKASATNAGTYTIDIKPAEGFTWKNGDTTEVTYTWNIGQADNLDLPTGLSAAAPSVYGASDGKLTGTTAEMEYSADEDFTSPTACTANETTGLTAGDYYVRIAESTNYKAGPAVMVTVLQGPVTVTSVAIATPATKTAYKVGESLDVTGLTLTVTLSDGSTSEVSVNPGMITGFSSSSTAPSQTLTVTYGGKTTTYTVSITEDSSSGGDSGDSGNTGGGSTGGGSTGGGSTGGGTSGTDTGTTTVKNPDGSTTTTTTDAATGTVTETTEYTDGTTTSISTDKDGKTQTQVKLSQAAVEAAQKENEAVSLPIPAVNAAEDNAPVVEITLPGGGNAVKVEIPVKNAAPGVVAVVVDPDGTETVVKKSAVTKDGVALVLKGGATVKLVDNSTAFSDVPVSSWAKSAADFVSARGIFKGTGHNAFSPDSTMTRGMLAVVLYNMEDSPAHAFDGAFADVGESWYTDAVHWAAEQGIVTGYGDGRYGPNDAITREQLAVILWRYAGSPAAEGGDLPFADAGQVSSYAVEALCWAKEQGIVNGVGNGQLMPKGLTTRAQAAQMLMNFIQMQF